MKDPREILLKPVVSEKAFSLLNQNKYTFLVDPRSNKTEIKIAVEKVFGVKVLSVNTMNREGKRNDTKRAIVQLAPGDSIEIFGGPVS